MSRLLPLLSLLTALLCPGTAGASAPAEPPTRGGPAPAKRVYVGVYVHDVSKFELKDGLYNVDLEYWAKWRGRFDGRLLRLSNGDQLTVEPLGSERDGDWHAQRFRVRGTLRGNFPVHRFPLDEQTLRVSFELAERHGRLVPDLASSGMAKGFSITDWHYQPEFRPEVTRHTLRSDLGSIDNEGQPSRIDRVSFLIHLSRPIMTTVLKLFLPLCIVGLVAFIALFLHPDLIDARSAIGITALLSCFAFQFTIADSLPEVAYLTLADQLFLIAYLFSSVVLVVIVISYNLHRRGHPKAALATDRAVRLALPLLTAAGVWLSLPAEVPATVDPVEPLTKEQRAESARDLLRIGSNISFKSILSLAATGGVYWPLVREAPDGTKRALLVERTPSVSNRAMRFLSGGGLEVTWRLRPQARWSDGEPITAKDLLLVRRVLLNEHIESFRAADPRTMVIRWKTPLAQSLEAPGFWPDHVLGRYVTQARGDSAAYKKIRRHRRRQPIPSAGPYRIVSFERGRKLVVEANPHFIGAPPAIRRVEEIRYPSREALLQAFKRGEIDITIPNGVTMKHALALAAERPEAVHVVPSNFIITLAPDLAHPALKQLAVRRALLLAIDRQRLAREVYGAAGRVADVPVPGPLPPGALATPHDPKRARALLAGAGHGAGLRLKLYMRGSSIDRQIFSLVSGDLARVGVQLEQQLVKSTFKRYQSHSHQGLVLHVFVGRRSKNPMAFWNLPVVAGRYPPTARNAAYTDEVHALVERDLHAIYPERRRQLRDRLFAEFSHRLPHIPLLFAAKRVLADPKLRGWQADPEAYFGTGLERWYFAGAPKK